MREKHFHNLFVFGRPASGKSEFIDFMKHCDERKRLDKMHIAPFEMIDEYFFIVEIAEIEAIFEKFGLPRRITKHTEDGIVLTDPVCFDYDSEKTNRVIEKENKTNPNYFDSKTRLVEFSRSTEPATYRRGLSLLNQDVLKHASIIYIKASYAESVRRNEARYQEKLKHSFLAHKVPDEALERYFRDDDWSDLTKGESHGHITINGVNIPFVTMDNEQESKDPVVLEERYATALQVLNQLWSKQATK
jgi:hypothetical protein